MTISVYKANDICALGTRKNGSSASHTLNSKAVGVDNVVTNTITTTLGSNEKVNFLSIGFYRGTCSILFWPN